jgi:hypothetical protein
MTEAAMSTESLPFEEMADTGIVEGNGSAEALASEPGSDSQVADSSREESDSGDYESRLREGGEFAVEQTKGFQRKFGEKVTRVQELEKQLASVERLLPIVDQLGGADNVIGNLEQLGRLYGNENLKQAIMKFEQTGTFEGGAAEDPDEYVDPLEAELRGEIRAMKSELNNLKGSSLRQDGDRAQQKLRGNFEEVFKQYPFTAEERARIDKGVETTLKSWSGTAEGIRTIESLDAKTARNLIINQLDPDEQEQLYLRRARARHEKKGQHATDAPASTATGRAASAATSALDAFREACSNEGVNADRFLG